MARVLRAEWALAGALWLGLPAAFCASGCAPGGVTGSAGTAHAAAVPAVRFEDVTTERGIDFRLDHPDPAHMLVSSSGLTHLGSERTRDHLRRAGVAAGDERRSEEFILVDLQAARARFDEVIGRRTPDDVLQHIFEKFCIGK